MNLEDIFISGWTNPRTHGSGNDLVVAPAEEMIPETLRDSGPDFQDLGDVFPTDHHVPVVELHVHVRLLVQQVIGAAGRSEPDQLPEITVQLMAARSLSEQNHEL